MVAWHAKFVSRARADKAARVLKAVLRFASDRHDLRSAEGKVATDALRTLRLWSKPKRKKTIVRDMLAWQKAVAALPNEAVREYLTTSALTGLRRRMARGAMAPAEPTTRCAAPARPEEPQEIESRFRRRSSRYWNEGISGQREWPRTSPRRSNFLCRWNPTTRHQNNTSGRCQHLEED